MNVKRFLQGSLLLTALLFSACSSERMTDEVYGQGTLNIRVKDASAYSNQNAEETRAVQHEYATTFSPNDAIGVFEVKEGKVTHANVRYVFDGSRWNSVNGIAYDNAATYYSYFPYAEDRAGAPKEGEATTATTADEFFADVISNFTPQKDQSTGANYDASDLMVSKGDTPENDNTIIFPMFHKMGLAIIKLGNLTYVWDTSYKWDNPISYNFVGENQPLSYDGVCRYIVKPNVTNELTIRDGNLLTTVHVKEAGKYQTYEIGGEVKYDAKIGDIMYNDGSLTHPDNYDGRKIPIGILGYIYQKDGVTEEGYNHGLVIGVKSMGIKPDMPDGINDSPLFILKPSLGDQVRAYGGLENTKWLKEHNSKMTDGLDTKYLPAPDATKHNNSGWFIPASGQLLEVIEHKLGNMTDDDWDAWCKGDTSKKPADYMNYFKAVGGGNYSSLPGSVCASTRVNDGWFSLNPSYYTIGSITNSGSFYPFLAF